jgi:hypothetical protein
MRCVLVDARSRQYVVGLEDGVPVLASIRDFALRFRTAEDARTWIAEQSLTQFGALCLVRDGDDEQQAGTRAAHHKR